MKARLVLLLGGAIALLIGASLVWRHAGAEPRGPEPAQPTEASAEPRPAPKPVGAPIREPQPAVQRVAVAGPDAARTEIEASQGWRGVVLDVDRQPIAGARVHLFESTTNQPLALPLVQQQRLPLATLASVATGLDGTFAIGLPVVEEKAYELFVVAPGLAAARHGGLRLLADQWYDLGVITLGPGATLRGRVTVAGAGTAIPTAVVTIETATGFVDAAMRTMPETAGRLSASCDTSGAYELRNVPRHGQARVYAEAPGFARMVRGSVDLSGDGPLVVDFELPAGASIRGRVLDGRGRAVPEANVEAWPADATAPPFAAESDRDGAFSVQHLTAGSYRLRVTARGFLPAEQPGVPASSTDVLVAMQPAGSVRLRVRDPAGAVVRRFLVGVRRTLPDRGDQLAFVVDVPDRSVVLDGATDTVVVDGIPAGTFVCQVECAGYATTRSAPFAVHLAADTPPTQHDIDLVLTTGATLIGHVLDEAGRPLAAATVSTQPDGAQPDNPLWRVLAGASATRTTARTASTDAAGRFELPLLALAEYQLEVQHPDACVFRATGIRLDQPGARTLPPLRTMRGALVAGRVTIDGRTAAQVKIVLTSPSNAQGRNDGLRLETIADAEGHFQLPRRVPPGMYELRAAVVDTADPEARHFQQLRQLQRSAVQVVVPAGQDRVERDLDIPNDH